MEKSSIKSNTWELKWNKSFIWKHQVNHVAIKLNKVVAMLSKLKYFVDRNTLMSVYYAMFESYLCCASLVWDQSTSLVKRLDLLQKNSLRIMLFSTQAIYLKNPNFLSPFISLLQKTAYLLEDQSRGYCFLPLIAGSVFF